MTIRIEKPILNIREELSYLRGSPGTLKDKELTNIGAVKALDQGVAIIDTPEFNGIDLSGIDVDVDSTAVDVFVYDTTLDSDGGAWRERTQGTSWYNETLNTATRGVTRKFPSVPVLIAETDTLTVFDGDDPSLPMWHTKVYTGLMITSVFAINGKIIIGTTTGLIVSDFAVDKLGTTTLDYTTATLPAIVNSDVNDVAMTVFPDAPVDPATGLQVPTIAVATDGGVSVIKDDGSVVDSSDTNEKNSVSFTEQGDLLTASHSPAANSSLFLATASAIQSDGWSATTIGGFSGLNGFPLLSTTLTNSLAANGLFNVGQAGGLCTMLWNSTENQSLLQYTTASYSSGWMVGGIKGAWLADTVAGTISGTELVTNGNFDADISGWALDDDDGVIIWDSSGAMSLEGVGGYVQAKQSFTTTIGQSLKLEIVGPASGNIHLGVGPTDGSTLTLYKAVTNIGTYSFIATSTETHVLLREFSGTGPSLVYNVSISAEVADRSVNNNGLKVIGDDIVKTAVATGAELMGFSGFNSNNYLVQPYNSDLDFGTGDFSIMGWINVSSTTSTNNFFSRGEGNGSYDAFSLNVHGGLYKLNRANVQLTGITLTSTGIAPNIDAWDFFVFGRINGVLQISINNGEPFVFSEDSLDLDGSSSESTFLKGVNHSKALFRISNTHPSAEQISKIYRDELPLFRENEKCTIFGTSDSINALARDESTNLLHVGTSDGMSSFYGLRRVSNTTRPITTAISAVNNMIVEE